MTMTDRPLDCCCLNAAPTHPHAIEERFVGTDPTDGRFALVRIVRCRLCRRLWVVYSVEYEHRTASGRWGAAVISEKDAGWMSPERAAGYIERAPWNVRGGSFFGHAGKRGHGRLRWNL
jgi:hypothetical protein